MAVGINESDMYLAYKAEQGIDMRYGHKGQEFIDDVVVPRIKRELKIISKMGFSNYFLILADIMDYCHSNDIPVGPARGSAGGSIISYLLQITEVDPIEFDLIFERFLNDERYSPPDIDVDLCWNRRQEVLDYVYNKYGTDKVAQIITFGTLSAKSLLDDLGRVYKVPKKDIEDLKAIIDDLDEGDKLTYDVLIQDETFRNKVHELEKLDSRIVDGMAKLEGLHRHTSLHAGGLIISDRPMHDLAPTFQPSRRDGRIAVQYEMNDAEDIGLLKMDLLGLRTITMIDWAEKDVRRLAENEEDKSFNIRKHTMNDKKAFDIINKGNTAGIFQLEGTGITRFAQEMHIESFDDIVALLALYRPGTLDAGSAQQYIDRKNGKEPVEYPHDDLKDVLKDTYGIIVYQEQVMHIMGIMAGYSMGQADTMRKAIGKKDAKLMEKELATFKEKSMARGYSEETCDKINHLIETFGRYGFNKSHAVAYAYLTYWTAVLKARYPSAFYSAWLNITEDRDKIGWIMEMIARDNIKILPPDINKSGDKFTPTDHNTIRFGLSAIKGMGKSFVNTTISDRDTLGEFSSFIDYCRRLPSIPIDKKRALVGAGAFDFEIKHREYMHRGFLLENIAEINECSKESNANKIPKLKHVEPLKPLEMGELEKEYLSFYLTADPLDIAKKELKAMGAILGVETENLSGKPLIGGRVAQKHTLKTRKGQTMAFIDIDDGQVEHTVTFFPSEWARYQNIIDDDKFLAIRCTVDMFRGKKTLNAETAQEITIENLQSDISINIGKYKPMDIMELKNIIDNANAGSSNVTLIARNDDYEFDLQIEKQIEINEKTLDDIKALFGADSIKLIPKI